MIGRYHAAMSAPAPELPRFRLFDGPSPLEPVPRFSTALGGRAEIWVKREDLLPLAFGGNKLRNLEFLVGAALSDGADTLVTSGRRWSNHCRLTAAAGAKAGLAVELVLSGPPAPTPGPGVRLMTSLGATVHQLPTADRAAREAGVVRVAGDIGARGGRPYVIGVGGTGALGAWGQVLAARELFDQADAAGLTVDVIVVPSATGGTQAGLLAGAAGRSPGTRIAGVVVARPASELRPAIATMVSELLARPGGRAGEPAQIELDETQLGDGYGRPTAAAAEAASVLARTEAILVDPIYTAKALAFLVAAVRGGAWDGRRLVFWHAGGLPGIFEPLD
jgi:1-aminocyclopropane-1-carboxylate deaminase/D-cysteine desulfhydrase-like pyridoxal-dependent ACC family enzyme